MAAPADRSCCSREHHADKPLDGCMWGTFAVAMLTAIIGIVCLAIGAVGFGGTIVGALMVVIGGCIAIPAVFLKCKACMVTFVPFTILLCVVGGIIVGAVGLLGGVVGAWCDILKTGGKTYICEATYTEAKLCYGLNWKTKYKKTSDCNTISTSGVWGTKSRQCCIDFVKSGADNCITKDRDGECKKGSASFAAGYVGIVAAIFGCITTCLACCTCCGPNSFYGYAHLDAPPAGAAPAAAAPVAVAQPAAPAAPAEKA